MPNTTIKRRLLWLWIALGVVVWNGVFDVLVTRGVKEYLFRQAAYDAGRDAPVSMRAVMDATIGDAAQVASVWAVLITGAGVLTVRLLTRTQNTESRIQKGSA